MTDFWVPRDGSYYVSDIRDKFPDEIEEDALDTQKYVVAQIQECYSCLLYTSDCSGGGKLSMGEIFLKLLNMSITASWIILAVLGIRLLFRRIPKWISCLLWGIVAIRLIFPFSIESALDVYKRQV